MLFFCLLTLMCVYNTFIGLIQITENYFMKYRNIWECIVTEISSKLLIKLLYQVIIEELDKKAKISCTFHLFLNKLAKGSDRDSLITFLTLSLSDFTKKNSYQIIFTLWPLY